MNVTSLIIQTSIIVATYTIAILAAFYSEWLWSAFFLVDSIDKVIRLKEEVLK